MEPKTEKYMTTIIILVLDYFNESYVVKIRGVSRRHRRVKPKKLFRRRCWRALTLNSISNVALQCNIPTRIEGQGPNANFDLAEISLYFVLNFTHSV